MRGAPAYAYLPTDSPDRTVVFAVQWTEDADELYSDAEQWLVQTSGQVRLVITVRLVEDYFALGERSTEVTRLLMESPPDLEERLGVAEELDSGVDDNQGLVELPAISSESIGSQIGLGALQEQSMGRRQDQRMERRRWEDGWTGYEYPSPKLPNFLQYGMRTMEPSPQHPVPFQIRF